MKNLEKACILSSEEWINELPETPPKYEYSKKHLRAMKKITNKMRGDKYHTLTSSTVKILVAAAIIASLVLTVFAIPTTREYIIEKFKDHSMFQAQYEKAVNIDDEIMLGYIPDGFELEYKYNKKDGFICEYKKYDGWFSIEKMAIDIDVDFDTEEYEKKEIEYNRQKHIIYKSIDENKGCIYLTEKYIYRITGNIDENEMVKILSKIK